LNEDNNPSDAVSVSGETSAGDSIAFSGVTTFEEDTSANYFPDCQLEESLCFLIMFSLDDFIPAGSMLTVQTTNIKNPESIAKVGEIIVTTLMKYQDDIIYYKIDTKNTDLNFRATRGELDDSLMIATAENEAEATFATNAKDQVYEIEFTTTHAVRRDGWITLVLPDSFSMESTSSAVALF